MKKVMVCGCGAQGSTICRKLDEEPNIVEIVCADYNLAAAEAVCGMMKKGTPKQVNAANVDEIVAAAEGCELIVNVMPLDFGINVLQAAMQAKCCYQDLSACENVGDRPGEMDNWLRGIEIMYEDYGKVFAENDTTALVGTGSAPGLSCVIARKAVSYLDTCDTVNVMVYEGAEAKRFIPFWWSPITALCDMEERPYGFDNGVKTRPANFSRPIVRCWPEYDNKPVTLVEHCHEEPAFISFNAEKYFKGCQNAFFKYGGPGVDFALPLYRAGLLSHEEVEVNGQKIVPFDVVMAHIPPAPKDPDEIGEIIREGLVQDGGAFVVEAYGKKDGKDVCVEIHVAAPGLVESYERAKMTGEMYLTGQSAFLFTKLFVNDMMPEKGLITSDMMDDEQVEQYLKWAAELDITYTVEIKEGLVWTGK